MGENKFGCDSFTHVYLEDDNAYININDRETAATQREKRITSGLLLTFDQAFQFVGFSHPQPRTDREIRGIKVVAIPSARTVNRDHQVVTSVFLSHNLTWQPIVGRATMIHLGYRSEYKREIRHEHVGIGVLMNDTDLEQDIKWLKEKFNKIRHNPEQISRRILKTIVNRHEYDKELTSEKMGFRSLGVEDFGPPKD